MARLIGQPAGDMLPSIDRVANALKRRQNLVRLMRGNDAPRLAIEQARTAGPGIVEEQKR
jgi:hypothetical protein